MKFAHLADIHIGAWRDERMRMLPLEAFERAIETSLKEGVDFILLAGDIFNTSIPPLDDLKRTTSILSRVKEAGVSVYIVPGSHDFSPSGKTMLDVLEEAGLWKNVVRGSEEDGKLKLRFTLDKGTGAKITGMLGRRAGLERTYLENMALEHLEREPGFKIFVYHGAVSELLPKSMSGMEAIPLSLLPKGFDYYACGHVHIRAEQKTGEKGVIAYPGHVFPNSFSELEELGRGGFILWDEGEIKRIDLEIHPVRAFTINADGKSPSEVTAELARISLQDIRDAIVTVRVKGQLSEGRASEINFKEAFREITGNGAFFVMKNTSQLSTKEFAPVSVAHGSVEELEERVIEEHLGQVPAGFSREEEKKVIKELMRFLNTEKREGETRAAFEERVREASRIVLSETSK